MGNIRHNKRKQKIKKKTEQINKSEKEENKETLRSKNGQGYRKEEVTYRLLGKSWKRGGKED
jgi:hypothetical protein